MRRQQGFSLLEVLVAFAILSISLGILYQALGGSLRNLAVSGAYDRAMILAESKLAEAAARTPLEPGSHDGQAGDFHWRVEVSLYEMDEALPRTAQPYRIVAKVFWTSALRQRSYRLETLRLGPAR